MNRFDPSPSSLYLRSSFFRAVVHLYKRILPTPFGSSFLLWHEVETNSWPSPLEYGCVQFLTAPASGSTANILAMTDSNVHIAAFEMTIHVLE